jgi:hypothetical protein
MHQRRSANGYRDIAFIMNPAPHEGPRQIFRLFGSRNAGTILLAVHLVSDAVTSKIVGRAPGF